MMDDTLTSAREEWREVIKRDGGRCPCCDRFGKIYARKFNSTMARSLIWLSYAECDSEGWVDVPMVGPAFVIRTNQLPTVRWWNLIERRENDDPKKKDSGMWRITRLGEQFVSFGDSIRSTVFSYNAKVIGYSDDQMRITEAFKSRFDYDKVMRTWFDGYQSELF
jgi:hypothetical protein